MLTAILSFLAGAIAGFVGAYFVWRNNKEKVSKYTGTIENYEKYLNEFKDNYDKK